MNEKIKKPFFSLLIGFFLLAIAFVKDEVLKL